jgi:twinkle protein
MTELREVERPRLTAKGRDWLSRRGLDSELAESLGLTSGELTPGGAEWIKVPLERDGVLVNWILKHTETGESRLRRGAELLLWREESITDAGLADQPLIITEGPWDALAAIQAGFWRTCSMPNGAPQKASDAPETAQRYRCLDRPGMGAVREIIIAADGDAAGHALLTDMTHLLGPARCRFLAYPAGCKDLNDVLLAHAVDGVRRTIEAAKWSNVAGVYKRCELPPLAPLTIWRPDLPMDAARLIPLCPGHVSVWTGVASFGKSTLLNACAWSIAERHGLVIAHGAFETTPQREYMEDLIAFRTGCAVGDRDMPTGGVEDALRWADDHLVFINADGAGAPQSDDLVDATLDWFISCAVTAIVRHGARIVILDPWSQLDHDMEGGEREDQYVRRALKRLKMIARTHDCHIAIVAHPRKPRRDADGGYEVPEGYDISGSAHWFNGADLGVTAHRAGTAAQPNRVLIRVWKVKNHRMMNVTGEAHVLLDSRTGRYSSSRDDPERGARGRKDVDG